MSAKKLLIQRLQDNGLAKRILPEANLTSRALNGVGAFVPGLCRLTITANTPRQGAGGDSQGMIQWIASNLKTFAAEHKFVEIRIVSQAGPPSIRAEFNNNSHVALNTPRWSVQEIQKTLKKLATSRGSSDATFKGPVRPRAYGATHMAPWDAFHSNTLFRP